MSRIRGNCFETMSFLELMLLLLENAAPVSLCLNARPKMVQGSAWLLHPLCCIFSFLVRYCSEDSFGDFMEKCAAGGNNPLVLKLSARIITASKRHLSLSPPPSWAHWSSIFVLSFLRNHHEMHCLYWFLFYRFKDFSPEVLVTFVLRVSSNKAMLCLRHLSSSRIEHLLSILERHKNVSARRWGMGEWSSESSYILFGGHH